jgi:hypothetical protein
MMDDDGASRRNETIVQRPKTGAALRGSRQSQHKNTKPALGPSCGSRGHMVRGMLEARCQEQVTGVTSHWPDM